MDAEQGTRFELAVTLTNEDEGYRFAEFSEGLDDLNGLAEDGQPDFGDIYRWAQREYGRCMSSVYVDTDAGVERVGWFFLARERYEDTGGVYRRGAWVSVVETTPAVSHLVAVA
jgi:hypothetical protein